MVFSKTLGLIPRSTGTRTLKAESSMSDLTRNARRTRASDAESKLAYRYLSKRSYLREVKPPGVRMAIFSCLRLRGKPSAPLGSCLYRRWRQKWICASTPERYAQREMPTHHQPSCLKMTMPCMKRPPMMRRSGFSGSLSWKYARMLEATPPSATPWLLLPVLGWDGSASTLPTGASQSGKSSALRRSLNRDRPALM